MHKKVAQIDKTPNYNMADTSQQGHQEPLNHENSSARKLKSYATVPKRNFALKYFQLLSNLAKWSDI